MLIDLTWRGLIAQAGSALRGDAGRALVALGTGLVRAGRRIGGRALLERELREVNRQTTELLNRHTAELRARAGRIGGLS